MAGSERASAGANDNGGDGRGASGASPGPITTVPAGHEVAVHRVSPSPRVERAGGGVWMAHLGTASDDLEESLTRVLAEVESLVAGPRPRVLAANLRGSLSELFAPHDPSTTPLDGLLVWTLDAAGLAGAPHAPALLQRLLRRMYLVARAEIPQAVFAFNAASPAARVVTSLFREVPVGLREPDPRDGAAVLEVRRPEGITLTALVGRKPAGAGGGGSWVREINEEKDALDTKKLAKLESKERDTLERRLTPEGGTRRVGAVDRAPRLRALLLALAEGGGVPARKALYEELSTRAFPMVFTVDPKTQAASLRSWPGGASAMPVYADTASLLRSTRETGMAPGSFAMAQLKPTALFEWGAKEGWAVAIGVYNEAGSPLYVMVPQEDVRALAKGKAGA